jgi:hypothetical protein
VTLFVLFCLFLGNRSLTILEYFLVLASSNDNSEDKGKKRPFESDSDDSDKHKDKGKGREDPKDDNDIKSDNNNSPNNSSPEPDNNNKPDKGKGRATDEDQNSDDNKDSQKEDKGKGKASDDEDLVPLTDLEGNPIINDKGDVEMVDRSTAEMIKNIQMADAYNSPPSSPDKRGYEKPSDNLSINSDDLLFNENGEFIGMKGKPEKVSEASNSHDMKGEKIDKGHPLDKSNTNKDQPSDKPNTTDTKPNEYSSRY